MLLPEGSQLPGRVVEGLVDQLPHYEFAGLLVLQREHAFLSFPNLGVVSQGIEP